MSSSRILLRIAASLAVAFALLSGCSRDAICRSNDPSKAGACCAKRSPEENNCMACASQPSCGWCETPADGQPHCQAAKGSEKPVTCVEGWSFHTGTAEGACPRPMDPPGGVD